MARALQTWSPFRELERFRRDFDEMFDRVFGSSGERAGLSELTGPALESYVEGDKMVIRADLPGVDPDNVEVTVTGNTLRLRAIRRQRSEDKRRDFMHREVAYGSIERSLTLPAGVRTEEIKASYHNGVLELTMPMPTELTPRKVPVTIEATGKNEKS